jgi:hypothetical protein
MKLALVINGFAIAFVVCTVFGSSDGYAYATMAGLGAADKITTP